MKRYVTLDDELFEKPNGYLCKASDVTKLEQAAAQMDDILEFFDVDEEANGSLSSSVNQLRKRVREARAAYQEAIK